MPQQVIVYHSQAEANTDWFMNNVFYPWVVEHWAGVSLALLLFIVACVFLSARSQGRRW